MIFTSLDFIIFLIFILAFYWSLKNTIYQNYFLVAGSMFFYGYADWRFLSLIISCAIIGYVCAIAVENHQKKKKLFLILGISGPFGILFAFKYYNFFIDSVNSVIKLFGLHTWESSLSIILPIGISFFTFQTVGYLIDVYSGKTKAEKSFFDLLLFVSFFPQLVAGPIERYTHLMPQIKNKRGLNYEDIFYGCYLILQGFIKKMVIADNLAPIVNMLFAQDNLSGPLIIVGLLAFAFQIYGDFSGYTDIARGTARLMGFKILLNFNHPYMSLNPTDFWRRWHITLSNWFKDYLYIPLGGNRKGQTRTYINILITWILCGLWHGASYNFILWGGYHGIALITHKIYSNVTEGFHVKESRLYVYLARTVTFIVIVYGWIFFRITDANQILTYSIAILTDRRFLDVAFLSFSQIFPFVSLMMLIDYFESKFLLISESKILIQKKLAPYFIVLLIIFACFISETGGDFIYFKF